MKILSDTSKNEHECTPFNLNRNPLSKFSKGYPKLFEFQHQQIMYVHYFISLSSHDYLETERKVAYIDLMCLSKFLILFCIIFVVKPLIILNIKINQQGLLLLLVNKLFYFCN
jgi:hypothetical protein